MPTLALLAAALVTGVPIHYQLPLDGPLPHTYRVTLAITDQANPDWLISTFVAGAPRTVTAENRGQFTDEWNGLDDNFMPVPPGTYGVKGIVMRAEQWPVDGEWHSVVPRYLGAADAWAPAPGVWQERLKVSGDPCGAPLADVDVAPGGRGVVYFQYLENSRNCYLTDFARPIGPDQILASYPSGSAAGGSCTCTDGQTIWSFSTDGGPKFVFRADGRPFGRDRANRDHVYRPAGWVTALAAGRDAAGRTIVCVAQRGKLVEMPQRGWQEDPAQPVDQVTLHDADGQPLGAVAVKAPRGLVARDGTLYILHADGAGLAVSSTPLSQPGALTKLFAVPAELHPSDLERDSHGRFYLSDSAANRVFQLDATGRVLRRFGAQAEQAPGAYDPRTFIAPEKLACWTDAQGVDRLLVVEAGGPNRLSEWSADGTLLREWLTPQTKANDGYAVDPEHPEFVYMVGQRHWLDRFKVDYTTGRWTLDAVWPHVGEGRFGESLARPKLIRRAGHTYLAFGRNLLVYRLAGDRWVPSAQVLRRPEVGLWHDANGDGAVQNDEVAPVKAPPGTQRYHGEMWNDDLTALAIGQGTQDVWRLAPARFDERGNPVFEQWERAVTDPIFIARVAGTADAVHGGNECADSFSSDWAQALGTPDRGYWVCARGGHGFSANFGAQIKLSRYLPGGKLAWRTGRVALQGRAQPGELTGTIFLGPPLNGLVSVIDQSRAGVHLYTEDGLFVDTLFPEHSAVGDRGGLYPQPGEFFAGYCYPNRTNGKVYVAFGKTQPVLFETPGWTLTDNPTRPLTTVDPTVTLTAAATASPPEIALFVRGGAGVAKVARFAPAPGGGPALDGSLTGWEASDPVKFAADAKQTVEVRCQYDPGHLYLRWHARCGRPVATPPLAPAEQLFTHDRGADTLGFYLQGDPTAVGTRADGRPGDLRVVFGLFRDGDRVVPAALGLWPRRPGGTPTVYQTPTGRVAFEHVGLLTEARLGYALDKDGQGYVLAAALPKSALPAQLPAFDGNLRTMVDFDANFGGHNRCWWSNADGSASRETFDAPSEARLYPGAWAQAGFQGLSDKLTVRNWLVCGPWGGPGAETFAWDLRNGEKDRYRKWQAAQTWPLDDRSVDLKAVYRGERQAGYWNRTEARWKPEMTVGLDTRVVFGPAAQIWYAASWVHVPVETKLDFRLQAHPQTYLKLYAGDRQLFDGDVRDESREKVLPVTLPAGWTQVWLRGYCVGYSPFRAGLVIGGTPAALWSLKLSATPPER